LNIETFKVDGFAPAVYAMRSPMKSWNKSDSEWHFERDGDEVREKFTMGEADKDLSLRLQKAGNEHCKHLRMIQVWVKIKADLSWWKQMDTYRFGVEKVATSTMHTLMKRPLTEDDFEHDSMNKEYLHYVLDSINSSMEAWRCEKDEERKKEIWRGIIQALPESYLQERTVMVSYAALRNIVRQREGHKLKEWKMFIDWARSLPNSWMIFE